MLGVGFSLHAEAEFLELTRPIIEDEADYFEVSPETLWRSDGKSLELNGYAELFAELKRRSGRPFVAHGLAFSLGSDPDDAAETRRLALWLQGLRQVQAVFDFQWFSDHLGWVFAAGLNPVFPLPLPPTREAAARVAQRLRAIQGVVPTTAFENPAGFFRLGEPDLDAAFWNLICEQGDAHLMLDLHNLYTESINLGVDPQEVLDQLDLDRVIQIHLSGGSESDPSWLRSRRVLRLDSHDTAIPEVVWELLEYALPRCRRLRGIVVERLNGTVEPADIPVLRGEIRRARQRLDARCLIATDPPPRQCPLPDGGGLSALQAAIVARIGDSNSFEDLCRADLPREAREALQHCDADGYRVTSLIVRKLRFERMCLADRSFEQAFDEQPEALIETYEDFARATPPTAWFPHEDARAYHQWRQGRDPGSPLE
ncbi:MAG: DUF692 family protein [Planctomycetes bacterium]|nr:DUF692 family protein [Planctomycetota bacterium]